MTAAPKIQPVTLPRPKAVLFDWDGTLADTVPIIRQSIDHILQQLGEPPAPFGTAELETAAGSLGIFLQLLGEERGQMAKGMYEAYLDILYAEAGGPVSTDLARPGAREILEFLRTQGIRTGIVTNKRRYRFELEAIAMKFMPLLDTTITLNEVVNRKPHPEMMQIAASNLGLAPGPDVWVVGDHQVDHESGKQAGTSTIHLAHGFIISKTHPPDLIIEDLSALTELIKKLA